MSASRAPRSLCIYNLGATNLAPAVDLGALLTGCALWATRVSGC